jgi:hypothetical protein
MVSNSTEHGQPASKPHTKTGACQFLAGYLGAGRMRTDGHRWPGAIVDFFFRSAGWDVGGLGEFSGLVVYCGVSRGISDLIFFT